MRHNVSHFQKQLIKQWIEAMGERPGRPVADPVTHQVAEFLPLRTRVNVWLSLAQIKFC